MKRFVSILLVVFVCLSCAFAYQDTYRQSTNEVQTFLLLRKLSGTETPDPTYPISGTQLAGLLRSLDTDKLDETSKAMYNELLNKLEHPVILFGKDGMGANADISLIGAQVMKSLEPDTYGILPFNERMPMGNIKATIYMKDYMTGLFDLSARDKVDVYRAPQPSKIYLSTLLNFMKYSEGAPDYAYASIGFDNLNFTIGRDRLAAGNGFTGNLALGENVLFSNFAKLSFVGSYVSYDFTINSFERDFREDTCNTSVNAMKKNTFIHRISFNIKDFMTVSAYEGALVYNDNVFADLQFLNPFMCLHNTGSYYEAKTNNFIGFEVSSILPRGIQLDGQFFVDQIAFNEDDKNYGENAFAALLNASKTQTVGNGVLDAYVEAVYGNPYVYLKNDKTFGKGHKYFDYDNENLDLVHDSKNDFNNDGSRELQYMGYRFGGNLLSVATGATYYRADSKYSLDLQYIMKGQNGIWEHLGERREAGEQGVLPMHVISVAAGYDQKLFKAVNVQVRLGANEYINYAHSGKNVFDPQFSVGINIHPLEFLKNRGSL